MQQYLTEFFRPLGLKAISAAALFILTAAGPSTARQVKETKPAGPPPQTQGAKPEPGKPEAAKPSERGTLTVKASKATPRTYSIVAKDVKMTELAAELAKATKAKVFLSPLMQQQRVTVELAGATLEGILHRLAPQPYVDYELSGDGQEPRALAVYLYALNERAPSTTEVVRGSNEAMLIEGDTEDGVGTEEEQRKRDEENPLKVTYAQNQLSVRARRQPLMVVVAKIAGEIGVPFEPRVMIDDPVDLDFKNFTLEQAVRTLSPAVKLYYRSDLQTYQIQPLRLVLAAPSTAQTAN
ncbi:MAG TPA: hypothetical protein VGX48_21640 [Pyrinomonadaceae bacterium]|jgi:hypothetical protein|nr:hypothetical protein [Pyrinomonadaceae bacterium]